MHSAATEFFVNGQGRWLGTEVAVGPRAGQTRGGHQGVGGSSSTFSKSTGFVEGSVWIFSTCVVT